MVSINISWQPSCVRDQYGSKGGFLPNGEGTRYCYYNRYRNADNPKSGVKGSAQETWREREGEPERERKAATGQRNGELVAGGVLLLAT